MNNLNYKDKKFLICGCLVDPPYVIYKDNKFTGICVDVWKKIVEDNQIKYKFKHAGSAYDLAIKDLQQNKYDILIGAFAMTPKRYELVNFTYPYLKLQI